MLALQPPQERSSVLLTGLSVSLREQVVDRLVAFGRFPCISLDFVWDGVTDYYRQRIVDALLKE